MPRKYLIGLMFLCVLRGLAQDPLQASDRGSISGTITDINGGIVPGATVILQCQSPCEGQSTMTSDTGGFVFGDLSFDTSYKISVSATGFTNWTSQPIELNQDQSNFSFSDLQMQMSVGAASVTVYASQREIATEQVYLEEQQRVLGLIPNFYVAYDSNNAVPLSTRLKFKLAMRVTADPVTLAGVALLAGMRQAGGAPNYVEGAKGYGQRFGAETATGFSDILIGGAVLPSLLHQDPRYFYQGTGTTSSRIKHALFSPFVCRGDNGRPQINVSSLGGDLASSALTETYYPDSNRGPRLVFGSFALGTGERMVSAVLQEFVVRRFTPNARKQHDEQDVDDQAH